MKVLRVAVIGCGNISVMHLDSIKALPESNLIAVCDVRHDRAKQVAEQYGAVCYTDYREMFQKEQLDVVHICLPHYLHTVVARDAFKANIHVLSEKPMTIGWDDAVDTVKEAEKFDVKYGVIFQCRYNRPSTLIRSRIDDNRLGKVKCARCVLTWSRSDDYYQHSDWKGTWEKEGGGVVIDQAIHSLDLANWFIGSEIAHVQSSLHNRNHTIMSVEDTAEGLVTYQNGATLAFYAMNNYLVDEPIEIRLVCENGTARLSYDDAIIQYHNGEIESVKDEPQQIVKYSGGKSYWGSNHAVQIHQFYQSVLGAETLEISGKEALKTHYLICAIYQNNQSDFLVKR